MANKDLSLKPHDICREAWWYEESAGIKIIVENYDKDGFFIEVKTYKISWNKLRSALKRKDK